jgi:multiple sugar transport system permease protein
MMMMNTTNGMPRGASPTTPKLPWQWVFFAPALLGFLVFNYLPTIASFALSCFHWNLLDVPQFLGGQNYERLLQSNAFWQACVSTLQFVSLSSVLELGLAILLALLVHQQTQGKAFFKACYFLPYVTPMVAVSLVFGWLYHPDDGLLNQVLLGTGFIQQPVAWLANTKTAMLAVVSLDVWKTVGYNFLLITATLESLPVDWLEAATLEGASAWQKSTQILLPNLLPCLMTVGLLTVIHALQAFDAVYLLTQGGPQNTTAVLVYWIYKNALQFFKIGEASAMAYLLCFVIVGVSLLKWWLEKRRLKTGGCNPPLQE